MCTACSLVCCARRTTHQRHASLPFNATCFALRNKQVCTQGLSRLDSYAESPSSSASSREYWCQRRPRLSQTLMLIAPLRDWAFCHVPWKWEANEFTHQFQLPQERMNCLSHRPPAVRQSHTDMRE
jgi:hypothetical protein